MQQIYEWAILNLPRLMEFPDNYNPRWYHMHQNRLEKLSQPAESSEKMKLLF